MSVDTGKYEVHSKQEIVFEGQTGVEKEALMSHNEDGAMLSLHNGVVEQKNVLRDNERNEAVKYGLKLEMVNEAEKVEDLKQHSIAEIKDEGRIEVESCDWHYDEKFERCQREVELLKEPKYRSKIAVSDRKMSHVLVEIGLDTGFNDHNMFLV